MRIVATFCICWGVASAIAAAPDSVAGKARAVYHKQYAASLPGMVAEAVRFPTLAGNPQAHEEQKLWLKSVAAKLGLQFRDRGTVTEVELAGPAGSPVLGLIVHGDVQPADASEWTHPPFAGIVRDGVVFGRGAADDKGPMVQALLAMVALRDTGAARTHTIRLLVGSDEESENKDFGAYLAANAAPAYSLVLDSAFPVIVGEKAWNGFAVRAEAPYAESGARALRITHLEAGLAASIVPSRAAARLEGAGPDAEKAMAALAAVKVPEGYQLTVKQSAGAVEVTALGRAAHAGMNIESGRNALVLLARVLGPHAQRNGAGELLAFAVEAGRDLKGEALGIYSSDPLWKHPDVNVATIKSTDGGALELTINVRSLPSLSGQDLSKRLEARLAQFNRDQGAHLTVGKGYFEGRVLSFPPELPIVKRLLADYRKATGTDARPAVSGGGTYAQRVPRSIAFGMWFPDKPYPGHDTDERVAVNDLNRGVDVLLEALGDLACSPAVGGLFGE